MRPRPHEFVKGQLGARTHEFDQLEVITLCIFRAPSRLEFRTRDVRQVAQKIADVRLLHDLAAGNAGADPIQETVAPGGECGNAFGKRGLIIREGGRKSEVRRAQCFECLLVRREERFRRWACGDGSTGIFGQVGDPGTRLIDLAHAEDTAKESMGIGRIDGDVHPVEGGLNLAVRHSQTVAVIAASWQHKGVMEESSKPGLEREFKRLERRLDELVGVVAQLKEENRALRQRQDTLSAERATLMQKNEQVRARVEAMIGRLKAMESGA